MQGQGESRRWRYGDYRRHKASARLFALWRGSGCDAVAPASRKLASGSIAGQRSGEAGAGDVVQQSTKARSRDAGLSRDGGVQSPQLRQAPSFNDSA